MNKQEITEIALQCGFKLKQQADGAIALNDYVFKFAEAIERKNNETLSIIAEIATKRNDSELFKVVADYEDKTFIDSIKRDARLNSMSDLKPPRDPSEVYEA